MNNIRNNNNKILREKGKKSTHKHCLTYSADDDLLLRLSPIPVSLTRQRHIGALICESQTVGAFK